MEKQKKKRLNLYISNDIIEFAKQGSYVSGKPISKMVEEYLLDQKNMVSKVTPFQWLNDPHINPSLPPEDKHFTDLEEYLRNSEEEEFCQENPEHPRAKMRKALFNEHEQYVTNKLKTQQESEKDLIKRWMEVFNMK